MKIPVIGTAIVNGPHWIKRLIESIDYPTENLVIFNNNGRGQITQELDEISKIKNPFIDKITVCHLPSNIGVAPVWNLIIKSYMMSPYWIICNHDISFTPGFLEQMVIEAKDNEVGMVHGKSGDFGIGSYDLFLIKDWVVQKYGLFDENFYPAYCEDVDYIMRFIHNPIKTVKMNLPYFHGDTTEYYESGSQTKKEDPTISFKLEEINVINFEYMFEKWGPNWRMCWPLESPFDGEDRGIKTTTFDLEYARRKYLGF